MRRRWHFRSCTTQGELGEWRWSNHLRTKSWGGCGDAPQTAGKRDRGRPVAREQQRVCLNASGGGRHAQARARWVGLRRADGEGEGRAADVFLRTCGVSIKNQESPYWMANKTIRTAPRSAETRSWNRVEAKRGTGAGALQARWCWAQKGDARVGAAARRCAWQPTWAVVTASEAASARVVR